MTASSPVKSILFDSDSLSEACLDDLQRYFWTRRIELLSGRQVPGSLELYQGLSTLLNVECEVDILSSADQSLFILCARPSLDDWNFGTCFPLMPGDADVDSLATDSSAESFLLRSITLQDPLWLYVYAATPLSAIALHAELNKIDLWNRWATRNHPTVTVDSGLALLGQLPNVLPDSLQLLADFIDLELSTLLWQANVGFPNEFPVLTLRLPLGPQGCPFGPGQLRDAAIELSSPLYFAPGNSHISLLGTLDLGSAGAFDAVVDFPIDSDLITVAGTYQKGGLPFVNAGELTDLPSLPPESTVDLAIALQFSQQQKTLTNVSFAVQLENWTLIDNILTLQQLSLSFSVFDPLGNKSVIAAITAEAALGNRHPITLFCAGYHPTNQFYLGLDSQTPLLIADFVADMGAESDGIPALQINDMSVDYNLTSEEFIARVDVTGAWEIIDQVVLSQLRFRVFGQIAYSCEIAAQFSIGGIALYINADYGNGAWQFQGGSLPGQVIPIGQLMSDLAGMFGDIELPEVLQSLEITRLEIAFNTATQDFYFVAETVFFIDDEAAALSINIDIIRSVSGFQKTFSGVLTLGPRQFLVRFEFTPSASRLNAAFSNPEGEKIHLINDLLGLVSSNSDLQLNDQYNLLELTLYDLDLSLEKAGSLKTYGIIGDFSWQPNVSIGGSESLQIQAAVNFIKPSNGKLTGEISGSLQVPIPDLEFLRLEAFYEFSEADSALGLRLQLDDVILEAAYTSKNAPVVFSVRTLTPLTFAKIMNFFAGLVDPSIDSFEFDPPWDTFTDIEIPINDFSLSFNTNTKEIGMLYTPSSAITIPGLPSSLLEIKTLSLDYGIRPQTIKGRTKQVKKLNLALEANFLGSEQDLAWDPINDTPPEVPGQGGSVFELRYLGMGQHIAFTQAGQVNSIKEVMDLLKGSIDDREAELQSDRALSLRNPLETFGDGGAIAFSPESEWLIGLDVTLLKMLALTIIFNDPVIYGLRIELSGKQAKNFAGLQFEILYQRITDTIGKYHIDLTLPDLFRHFQVGAVSVTLPIIVVDIFTNSDFKVDLGFPWDFNFSRSFALEVFPFTGAGGFYFNKLSAATATVTPVLSPGQSLKPADKGVFTPVYEFGLGLRVGLGKSFNSGPLRAEIAITVQGMIEGVIAWYNPIEPAGDRELFYRIGGGVAITGRLYGVVDFGIISVSVEVIAKAMIIFLIEVYQPIQVLLIADVSVKASIKVAFIRIRFSFGLRVEQRFTIPAPQSPAGGLPAWVQ